MWSPYAEGLLLNGHLQKAPTLFAVPGLGCIVYQKRPFGKTVQVETSYAPNDFKPGFTSAAILR